MQGDLSSDDSDHDRGNKVEILGDPGCETGTCF